MEGCGGTAALGGFCGSFVTQEYQEQEHCPPSRRYCQVSLVNWPHAAVSSPDAGALQDRAEAQDRGPSSTSSHSAQRGAAASPAAGAVCALRGGFHVIEVPGAGLSLSSVSPAAGLWGAGGRWEAAGPKPSWRLWHGPC